MARGQRTVPIRHPFVWIGCPVLLVVGIVSRDPITLGAMLALCAVLVAVAWPAEESRPMTQADRDYWSGFPYDDDPFQVELDPPHVPVTQVVDPLFLHEGEVMDELLSGDSADEMYGITPPKQIGSGT